MTLDRDELESLASWHEGGPPALAASLAPIRRMVDADECVACDWRATGAIPCGAGETSEAAASLRATLRVASACAFCACSPCLLAAGGSGVRSREDVEHALAPPRRRELAESLSRAGFARGDALRAVMASDDRPVACVAALRASGTFAAPARRELAAIANVLGTRLAADHLLGLARFATAAMEAALNIAGAPAFVLGDGGELVYANAAGRELVDDDPASTRGLLADLARGASPQGALVTRIVARGVPDHVLVVLSAHRELRLHARARGLAERWGLTPRQAEVLEGVSRGESNKEVAAALSCSEATVEAHLTAVLRKSGTDSRARLITRFWSGGES